MTVYIIIAIAVIFFILILKNKRNQSQSDSTYQNNDNIEIDDNDLNTPYKKKYLLTKNEWYFYKKLKPLADIYNLHIIAKIRLADLVEVDYNQTKEFNKYFAKIKSKHIDFALAKPDNLEVKYLIELDDNSHKNYNRHNRDLFINKVCDVTGYKMIRTFGDISVIEEILREDN